MKDPVRRKFEDEIAAGRILLVIDVEDERFPAVEVAMRDTGAIALPYESASALT